jgi:hypothetical protein
MIWKEVVAYLGTFPVLAWKVYRYTNLPNVLSIRWVPCHHGMYGRVDGNYGGKGGSVQ